MEPEPQQDEVMVKPEALKAATLVAVPADKPGPAQSGAEFLGGLFLGFTAGVMAHWLIRVAAGTWERWRKPRWLQQEERLAVERACNEFNSAVVAFFDYSGDRAQREVRSVADALLVIPDLVAAGKLTVEKAALLEKRREFVGCRSGRMYEIGAEQERLKYLAGRRLSRPHSHLVDGGPAEPDVN